jgi:hypothetical protein
MADTLCTPLGLSSDITVPASSKLGVWSLGAYQVFQQNSAGLWILIKDQAASQDQYTTSAVSASTLFRVQATGQQDVWASVGTNPVIRSGQRMAQPLQKIDPTAFSAINATATATIAQLMSGYITSSTAAAVVVTAPTAAEIDAATTLAVGDSFDVVLINTGGTNALSISGGTGNTYLGTLSITAGGMTARFVKTAAGAFTVFRV